MRIKICWLLMSVGLVLHLWATALLWDGPGSWSIVSLSFLGMTMIAVGFIMLLVLYHRSIAAHQLRTFTVRLIPESHTIRLSGHLTGEPLSPAAEQELEKLASYPPGSKWIVDAQQASILMGGTQHWLEIVDWYLEEYDLTYHPPSQLSLILLCDDDYRKRFPRAFFPEEALIAPYL